MNAKKEFLNHIGNERVLCAYISINNDVYNLLTGYTSDEFSEFISKLDFDYDDGYGGQNLFGTIWYINGNWSDRGEYDGSEWWEYRQVPQIPDFLDRNKIRAKKIDDII
jgi:hypothetical protein